MTGVILRRDRVVMRLFGRDPLKMIQGLATNDIAGADEGSTVYTAFLTPKGKMVGDARVLRVADGEILVEADVNASANIAANFKKFIPPLFARFEIMAGKVVLEVTGEHADDVVKQISHDAAITNVFRPDSLSLVISADAADAGMAVAREAGAVELSADELEVRRVEAGEPKWGAELSEDVIPLEAGLRHTAISESKGCYTGQEVIVRILHRGHVNRHLRGLEAGKRLPQVGAPLTHGDKVIGVVTSACFSQTLGQAIALAYVRREIEPGTEVGIDGAAAKVIELPFVNSREGATR